MGGSGRVIEGQAETRPILTENRCYLSGASRCYLCGGPLYRLNVHGTYMLRCTGTGADRHSCTSPANMVPLETAEALADDVLGSLRQPVYAITVVPGNGPSIDAQLARLDFERRQIAMRGLSWEEEERERRTLRKRWERRRPDRAHR